MLTFVTSSLYSIRKNDNLRYHVAKNVVTVRYSSQKVINSKQSVFKLLLFDYLAYYICVCF